MFPIEKAIKIAKEQFPEFDIYDITDIGEKFAFSFDTGDNPVPGIPFVCVSKENGEVSFLTIPPIENIKLIENGRKVKMK